MKSLGTSMFFVVLVSLFLISIPGSALAQSGGDWPCCFDAPSGVDLVADSGIQSVVIQKEIINLETAPLIARDVVSETGLLADSGLTSSQPVEFVAEFQIPMAEPKEPCFIGCVS